MRKDNPNPQKSPSEESEYNGKKGISRRNFLKSLKGAGLMTAGTVMAGVNAFGSEAPAESEKDNTVGPEATRIQLKVNGVLKELSVEPRETLADTLREHLHLTGTKVACNRGSCSSCTVLLDGVPVNSCMTLALDAVGREVSTIESLAKNGELHPLQQAFIDHDASQCGFCTPGMLMSCAHLLQTNPHPTLEEVKNAISGNLCRCGTHPHIFKAVLAAADEQQRK
jgi:aerobic-type carbon monoxide dehydrogenase small subunit (CoxS/CutS family)